jgi:phage tail sheath protein FI
MGFYWPAVKVSAPSITELATGATLPTSSVITISPEAFVAGARSRAVQQASGPWRAGAGQISASRTLRGLATEITPAGSDLMDEARVNVIRKIGNSIRVYGARSVSSDEANWRYITMRDTMNHITVGIEERMEEYVFETIDGRGALFGKIRGSIKAFLEPIRIAGGLYEAFDDTGAQIDPGYNVIVDSSINPVTQLATGLVKAQVGVRVSGVADLIDIVITKSNLSAPII